MKSKAEKRPAHGHDSTKSSLLKAPRLNARYDRSPLAAFCVFLLFNYIAGYYSPIQDCDEVYNFWEPTHYLNHGYGMQTWEYSPVYAIRSWLYISLHAGVIGLGRLLPFMSKVTEFYLLRMILATVCAACEARLFSALSRTLNFRVAIFFLIVMVTSPGMFHATVSYLPSSFAMYASMLGIASFMDWDGGLHTAHGILWFAIGGIIGWPFAFALALPFLVEDLILAITSGTAIESVLRFTSGTIQSLVVLAHETLVDSIFYKKLVCVPLSLVWYNVFSNTGKGPNIFGTEPWHFYVRNLLLNFHIWFVLAVVALPLLILRYVGMRKAPRKYAFFRGVVFVSPVYLWLAIFTLQPHKEERFMYPIYPALAINAAISIHIILSNLGSATQSLPSPTFPSHLKLALVGMFFIGAMNLGLWRMLGMTTAYDAPLRVYSSLHGMNKSAATDTVCLGKEWYRFPSEYFLPSNMRAKFVKSAFTGLLPGEFQEFTESLDIFVGTSAVPSSMNDENREDVGKYSDIAQCSFLIDLSLPSSKPSKLEPNYIDDSEHWDIVECRPFLDASNTAALGRLFWLPEWPIIPYRYRRKWGRYCLLRNRKLR